MSDIGKSLIQGALEALEYAKGRKTGFNAHKVNIPEDIDVGAIRKKLHMTRDQFSAEFGISKRTLEKWERGERLPESSARAYLMVIAKNPNAVIEALRSNL